MGSWDIACPRQDSVSVCHCKTFSFVSMSHCKTISVSGVGCVMVSVAVSVVSVVVLFVVWFCRFRFRERHSWGEGPWVLSVSVVGGWVVVSIFGSLVSW